MSLFGQFRRVVFTRGHRSLFALLCWCGVFPVHAAMSPSYLWRVSANTVSGVWYSSWLSSGPAVCAELTAHLSSSDANMNAFLGYWAGAYTYRNINAVAQYNTAWPSYKCQVTYDLKSPGGTTWYTGTPVGRPTDGPSTNSVQVYVSAKPPPDAQCDLCNLIGDPISPASGSVFETEVDLAPTATGLSFQRTYDSALSSGAPGLNQGWRYSFSRSLKKVYAGTVYRPWTSDASNSSKYTDEATACVSGFAEIKSQVPQWTSATASYSGGICTVSASSTVIATLPIFYTGGIPTPDPSTLTLVGYEATRDDGRVVSFMVSGSSIVAPPASSLKLQTSGSGFALTDEKDNVEYYDSAGKLQTVTSRAGVVQTVAYDGSGRLNAVTDSFGQSFSLAYHATTGLLSTLTDAASRTVQYGYTSSRLTSVTQTDNTVRTYHYENTTYPALLTGVTDEDNNRFATWGYDSLGRATSATGPGGANGITVVYNSNGSVTVTDALGAVRTFTFGRFGDRNLVTGISGSQCPTCQEPKTTSYDLRGFPTSRTDYNDNLTCYAYDTARGLELVRVEGFAPWSTCPSNLATYTPAGGTRQRKIATAWHSTYRLPSQIVEADRTTSFTFDGAGNVLTRTVIDTSVSPSVSRTWTYTYNAYGQPLTANGPRTDVTDTTTFSYYSCATGGSCGQLNMVTNALSQTTWFGAHNAFGRPLYVTDANGVATTMNYDYRHRLTSSQANSETTSFEYWPTGLPKKITLPDSSYLLYGYDDAHRLTSVTDGAGNTLEFTLDDMGNRTAENVYDASSALRRTHTRVFNSLSRLYQDVNAAGTSAVTTTLGYDGNGNITTVNAPLSRTTTNAYDELDRLKQTTDPASGVTQFSYDANDNLTSVTDPRSLVTSYSYTGFGDLLTQSSPDTGTTTNTYDSGGNLATSTDARSAVSNHGYDALNRVTSAAYKIGTTTDQTIAFTYDAGTYGKGRRTGASDANHSMSWVYDAAGRVTSKSQTVGTVAKNVGYGYTNGNLTSLTTPSGQAVVYGYNPNGQVTSITVNGTTLLSGVSYEPFGPIKGWTWGNGTAMSRTFDTDGKVTAIASAGNKTYTYDDAFRTTGITDTVTPANSYTYGFDGLDRLTSAVKTGTTRGWTYDANGNRLTETGASPSTYTVSSTNNRVSSITGGVARTYTYNAAGSALTYSNVTATYNNRGRMKTLKVGSTTATFTYNALGELVKRTGGTPGTVHYVYDEAGHLLGEYNSTGALVQETLWLGDTPVATLRPGTPAGIFYVHTDHLNTPRKVTRPSDNKARWTWESDPFGTALPNENPQALGAFKYNLRFPGQLYDAHTGLMYNYFRDYDAITGRYVQSDPIGLNGGVNTYGYVAGNPVSLVDPLGLYLYGVHVEITHTVTQDFGLAFRVANVDFEPGSQLDGMAHWHAMRPPWRSPESGEDWFKWHVDRQIASCTVEGLARALHAVQDSTAKGHQGFPVWNGGGFMGFPGWSHLAHDHFPTQLEKQAAIGASREVIDRFTKQCGCTP